MNAPESNFKEPHFGNIPLSCVFPSKTNPRKHFDESALAELAKSIKQHGVAQPILVRPLPTTETQIDCVEIVAGERRYRASKLAGRETIPAIVRDMTDAEALEIQVIENLQRQDVHPIEEAEGYEQLMKQHGYTADQLAEKVGKSRSYIYGRLKFCALAPATREAFFDGKLSASTALLIARIPSLQLQELATAELTDEDDPLSYRQACEYLQQRYMLDLSRAPFSQTDAKLVSAAGSCQACPKRTGNQPELYADVKRADICTDPDCFAVKRIAHGQKAIAQAKKKGIPVYTPDEYNNDDGAKTENLVSADENLWAFERRNASDNWKKVGDLLGVDARPQPAAYLTHKDGKVEELYNKTAMQEALEKAGVCEPAEQSEDPQTERASSAKATAPASNVARDLRAEAAKLEAQVRLTAYKRIRESTQAGLSIEFLRTTLKVILGVNGGYSDFSLPDALLDGVYDFDTSTEEAIAEHIDQCDSATLQLMLMDAAFQRAIDVGAYDMNQDGSIDEEDGDYCSFKELATAAAINLEQIRTDLAPAPEEINVGDCVRINDSLKTTNGKKHKCCSKEGIIKEIMGDGTFVIQIGATMADHMAGIPREYLTKLSTGTTEDKPIVDESTAPEVQTRPKRRKKASTPEVTKTALDPRTAWPFPTSAQRAQ